MNLNKAVACTLGVTLFIDDQQPGQHGQTHTQTLSDTIQGFVDEDDGDGVVYDEDDDRNERL